MRFCFACSQLSNFDEPSFGKDARVVRPADENRDIRGLFERARIDYSELPRLSDTLLLADRRCLVSALLEQGAEYAGYSSAEGGDALVAKRVDAVLSSMEEVSKPPLLEAQALLLPCEEFVSAGFSTFRRNVAARMLLLKEMPYGDYVDITTLDWRATLSSRVLFDTSWCLWERYVFLADVFSQMTYYGFDYEEVKASVACGAECEGGLRCQHNDAKGSSLGSLTCSFDEYQRKMECVLFGLNERSQSDFVDAQMDVVSRLDVV